VGYYRLNRYFAESIVITGDSGTIPAKGIRHAIGGLSVTDNLSDCRKVIMPAPNIIWAPIGDRGYYVVQFARLTANTDIH